MRNCGPDSRGAQVRARRDISAQSCLSRVLWFMIGMAKPKAEDATVEQEHHEQEASDGNESSVSEDPLRRIPSQANAARRRRIDPCRARLTVRRIYAPFLAAGLLLGRTQVPA